MLAWATGDGAVHRATWCLPLAVLVASGSVTSCTQASVAVWQGPHGSASCATVSAIGP